MTKNMKIAAIVSAAAMLVIGASMTSFAATGWQEEDGTWKYYDKTGEAVTNTWEKSGSNWFYLDDNGDMATDSLIEDNDYYYYVDANGAMVTNGWVQMDNSDDDSDDAPATVWYYFQNNGKAYKAPTTGKTSFKTINGKKYAFDTDAKMLFGWVNEDGGRETGDDAWKTGTYYCGDENDGAENYNSWAHLHVVDDREDDEDQDYWFYFGSNGKKYKYDTTNSGTWYEKTINGKKYTFDEFGKMLNDFVVGSQSDQYNLGANGDLATTSNGVSVALVKYFSTPEDGARYTKGWFRVVPSEYVDFSDDSDNDDNARWFYADGKGGLKTSTISTINGKKYGFDDRGEMVWGLRWVTYDSNDGYTFSDEIDDSDKLDAYTNVNDGKVTTFQSADKNGLYYFGDEVPDGAMKTGTQTVTVDGDSHSFKFKTSGTNKGKGVQGKDSNTYYVNGMKLKADSDDKYDIYSYTDSDKKLVKEDTAALYKAQASFQSYTNTSSGEVTATGYKGMVGTLYTQDTTFTGQNYIVVSSAGTWIKSGTKKDGNDYKIVVHKNEVYGIYVEN